jgi:hypothetical protein
MSLKTVKLFNKNSKSYTRYTAVVAQGQLLTGRHCVRLFLFSFACVHFCSEWMSGFGFKWGAKARLCLRANFSIANVLKLRSVYNLLLL